MSYYKYSPDFSYQDFLKQKKHIQIDENGAKHVVLEVSGKILDLLADEESLRRYNIEIQDSHPGLPSNPDSDYVIISYPIPEPKDRSNELLPQFRWGMADCVTKFGRMSESIASLIEITDTPQQTLAYTHFEKAREAFKEGDYNTALEEVSKATYGNSTSAGFQTEWRFYMLQGIIQLGFLGDAAELVDLPKAEEMFQNAALFAHAEYRSDAATAYMAAGWAAYCQGKTDSAIRHTQKALEHNSKLYEAHYVMAKFLLSAGKVNEAFESLSKAVHADAFYALKAAGDDEYHEHVTEFFDYLNIQKQTMFIKFKSKISDEMIKLKSQSMPPELKEIIDKFSEDKPLFQLSKIESEWNKLKVKPVFMSKQIENLKIEHEALVKVIEPYHEKVITKKKTWFRKEESKIVAKTKVLERKKKIRYTIHIFKDAFMFLTGKALVDFDMVLVPGSKFEMGDTAGKGRSDEVPIHKVELSPYLICRNQVTQKLWNLVMEYNPSSFQGFELPVENVSWYECIEFCNKLSILADFIPYYNIDKDKPDATNLNKSDSRKWSITCNEDADGYRMLTEAEWEFAAKGAGNSNFYTYAGSDQENIVSWNKDNSGFKTHPVAQKKPNELGLYDMSGNVWEWCWDWYDSYKDMDLTNPCGAKEGTYKVIRGGSWSDNRNYLRVASRGKENPTGHYSSIGLRIARKYVSQI